MSTIEEALNSPQAQYLGKIIDIDPTAKYANMIITKPENGWQKVEYWIKSENLGGDFFFQPPHPTSLYDPHGIAEKGKK